MTTHDTHRSEERARVQGLASASSALRLEGSATQRRVGTLSAASCLRVRFWQLGDLSAPRRSVTGGRPLTLRCFHASPLAPQCEVHENFRCIVLMDESKLRTADPPFLNRRAAAPRPSRDRVWQTCSRFCFV